MTDSQNELIDGSENRQSDFRFAVEIAGTILAIAIVATVALWVQKSVGGVTGFVMAILSISLGATAIHVWIERKKSELEKSA